MSRVFIISAPSGSGKSTLVARLMARDPGLAFSISYTTRTPRGTEKDGQQYRFVSRVEFERMRDAGEFLEWATVFGHYYGTHQSALEEARRQGKDLVLDIDVQGARQLKERVPGAVRIFILAPSREELAKRLRARSEDREEMIERRLAGAAAEIRDYAQYDYVLVNEEIETASDQLHAIVKAERLKRASRDVEQRVRNILASFE
jgi:guanylate kinase